MTDTNIAAVLLSCQATHVNIELKSSIKVKVLQGCVLRADEMPSSDLREYRDVI